MFSAYYYMPQKLFAFGMECYRQILRTSWIDKIRNEDMRKQISKRGTIINITKKRKLTKFGPICRLNYKRLVKHLLLGRIDGTPRKRRPCRKWLKGIKNCCEHSGYDLHHVAQDRLLSKKLIRTVVGPNRRSAYGISRVTNKGLE